jgi:hypothetical protein
METRCEQVREKAKPQGNNSTFPIPYISGERHALL